MCEFVYTFYSHNGTHSYVTFEPGRGQVIDGYSRLLPTLWTQNNHLSIPIKWISIYKFSFAPTVQKPWTWKTSHVYNFVDKYDFFFAMIDLDKIDSLIFLFF